MARLQDKVAVITGGSSGMRLATAKLFASEKAKVVIVGRSLDKLQDAESEIAKYGEVFAIQCDVSNLDELDNLYRQVGDKYGSIDILFANAGIGQFIPATEITEADFDKLVSMDEEKIEQRRPNREDKKYPQDVGDNQKILPKPYCFSHPKNHPTSWDKI